MCEHVCMCVCMCMHVCMYLCMCACVHVIMRGACACVYICMCECVYLCACMHVCGLNVCIACMQTWALFWCVFVSTSMRLFVSCMHGAIYRSCIFEMWVGVLYV
jgi:hypothetical protein